MTPENILKGALCGFVAGVAATIAKTVWEDYFPVRDEDTDTPPAIIAQRITERTLSDEEKDRASMGIHVAFGVGTGVLYGASGEVVPEITSGLGAPFGLGFYTLTHGSVVPALDLEPWPTEVKPAYAVNEFAGHFVYAFTLEAVRRGMRRYVVQ
jgi:putative membrane protein